MSIPEWDEEAPDVGEFLFPKGELILVQPGIGQTKPLGFVNIISESNEFEFEKESLFENGIKKIQIKRIIKIKNKL